MLMPFDLMHWIETHRDQLKPPVGNFELFPNSDYIVMAVGGPNSRSDFHINEGPEFFYQIQGDMNLRILENNKPKDIKIQQGQVFVLAAKVPHSPQRFENTVGLVIEQKRKPDEKDGFLWICESCFEPLYQEFVHVTDIVKQLPLVFDNFYKNPNHTTCKQCGWVAKKTKHAQN